MKYLSSQISLRLDVERCVGCGLCEAVCPHGVFLVQQGKARIQDRDACIECGACARNCPAKAISVNSGVGCAQAIINKMVTGKETCCGESGCCGASSENDRDDTIGKETRPDERTDVDEIIYKEKRMMSTQDNEPTPPDNMERLKQAASACGPGCACQPTGRSFRIRWTIGLIVLLAAGVLVARALVKTQGASCAATAPGYASLTVTPPSPSPALKADRETQEVGALSELNDAAADTDAVFVFLPGQDEASDQLLVAPIQDAARTIAARSQSRIGLFTLKPGSPDYEKLFVQTPPPRVLAMVKGRGMASVSGEITEAKLVQAFVEASSAGGCGPSAGAGCCPK
ncbi:MAG TPA: hypothetical protein DCZ95_01300 [Verrucomicrobia bacterium]|nr:MAG: hypothetical protein A2X46_08980 [Lentisphaerae bacterium GWF2_57_35]HBA82704.1 hypothetical protein [Verrucomicrobiota bacterium]